MRAWQCLWLIVLLLLPQPLAARGAYFVGLDQVDLTKLLPPPPAVDSPQHRQEIEKLLRLQHERSPDQEAFAQADVDRSVFRFADVLGEAFRKNTLPVAAAFFRAVARNTSYLLAPAKRYWNRPRPYVTNPAVQPCVPREDNASYPSGHAAFATVTSIILANMIPEKAPQIYERAQAYRRNREIGGVHHASDIEAGRIAGTVIAAFLFQDTAFQKDFARARAEMRRVLDLP